MKEEKIYNTERTTDVNSHGYQSKTPI